jgi:hypothetical protein
MIGIYRTIVEVLIGRVNLWRHMMGSTLPTIPDGASYLVTPLSVWVVLQLYFIMVIFLIHDQRWITLDQFRVMDPFVR